MKKIEDSRIIALNSFSDTRGNLLVADIDVPPFLKSKKFQFIHSTNSRKGTFRGIHTRVGDVGEAKFVYCNSGKIYDVSVDLRRNSNSYLVTQSLELDSTSGVLYLPPGVGHGFQTLENHTSITYLVCGELTNANYRRFNFRSRAFTVELPLLVSEISPEDLVAPEFIP